MVMNIKKYDIQLKSNFIINFGPKHSEAHGVLRLSVELETTSPINTIELKKTAINAVELQTSLANELTVFCSDRLFLRNFKKMKNRIYNFECYKINDNLFVKVDIYKDRFQLGSSLSKLVKKKGKKFLNILNKKLNCECILKIEGKTYISYSLLLYFIIEKYDSSKFNLFTKMVECFNNYSNHLESHAIMYEHISVGKFKIFRNNQNIYIPEEFLYNEKTRHFTPEIWEDKIGNYHTMYMGFADYYNHIPLDFEFLKLKYNYTNYISLYIALPLLFRYNRYDVKFDFLLKYEYYLKNR